ncbi:MAG TPA: NADH oxidase [Gemmatimonadetes bacterium]|nr:NADH oxidase [Gemmatimonadota bacterium]|tara:strand:- start:203 stop:544 length:342 start_codon:yes stop_codon:yes gene_type:complete
MNNDFDVKEITPLELKERLDSGDILTLVDVREYHEAEIADLPDYDQLRIPTGEFQGRAGEVAADADVVVYCRSGGRSAWAAAILMQMGYDQVLNLKGGVLGWRAEVDPSLRAY